MPKQQLKRIKWSKPVTERSLQKNRDLKKINSYRENTNELSTAENRNNRKVNHFRIVQPKNYSSSLKKVNKSETIETSRINESQRLLTYESEIGGDEHPILTKVKSDSIANQKLVNVPTYDEKKLMRAKNKKQLIKLTNNIFMMNKPRLKFCISPSNAAQNSNRTNRNDITGILPNKNEFEVEII